MNESYLLITQASTRTEIPPMKQNRIVYERFMRTLILNQNI